MATKINRGKPLEELVKGSMDYTLDAIRRAFRQQFAPSGGYESSDYFYIMETFGDHVIVSSSRLAPDEYYKVSYERQGETVTFTPRDEWEIVELSYQPQSMVESARKRGGRKLTESLAGAAQLLETQDGQPRRIKAIGITADVINGNGRRYPAAVLERAVLRLKSHLHESAGQGRLIERPDQLLGEVEHPSSKSGRPSLLETVVKWEAVDFDGTQVLLEGAILPTSKGKDIQALLEGGVRIPVSQRGYGEAKVIKEGNQKIEEVTDLDITGYDLVVEASDPAAEITESRHQEDDTMELDLNTLRERYPDLVKAIEEAHDEKKRKALEEQLKAKQAEDDRVAKAVAEREKSLRQTLGLKEGDSLEEALKVREQARLKLEEQEAAEKVKTYIAEQTRDAKYPDWLKAEFDGAISAAAPGTLDEAKTVIAAKRKEYDGIMAYLTLQAKGFDGVKILGPVLENETGVPEFARAAFELTESVCRANLAERRDFRKPKTLNDKFTALYLEKFDKQHQAKLLAEAKAFEEAEQASDLNLPYSVSRAIIAEAFPTLVAAGIFDVGMIDTSPTRLYFEAFTGETGYSGAVTNEGVTSDEGVWVSMANKRITPGSVVATDHAGTTTYVEGADYVIDYADGKFFTITAANGGTIGDGTDVHVDYTYTAIRKGEMSPIERGKLSLSFVTVESAADRLADQISQEAIVFSRAQLGWDAVSRTLASLINQVRRKIDQGLIYEALSAALKVAGNSGGTWTAATDPISEFVEKVGVAKVKILNRYYTPSFLLLSATNADKIANWDNFTAAGKRPDADISAEGYIGRLKGLPTFQTTEMSDNYALIGNRQVVMHRVHQALQVKGPYPTYDVSGGTSKLVAADQYYVEEFNVTEAPVPEKAAYVKIV